MSKKQLIEHKPAYRDGQLLLAEDFIAEQRLHIRRLDRHNLNLHGWGVVRGLDVARTGDAAVQVGPGYAIDGRGREIELREPATLDWQGAQPRAVLTVTVGFRSEGHDDAQQRAIACIAVLRVGAGIEEHDVPLATLRLDDRGRLAADGLDSGGRRSLQAAHVGWLRTPFRPIRVPEDQKNAPPPFRVGATQAVAHRLIDGKPNVRGAGGTMAIVLPPQVTAIHRLRVAGAANDKTVSIVLAKGQWDPAAMQLVKHEVVKEIVEGKADAGAFDRRWAIAPEHVVVDAECSTLSLSIRAEAFAAISLVALEVSW